MKKWKKMKNRMKKIKKINNIKKLRKMKKIKIILMCKIEQVILSVHQNLNKSLKENYQVNNGNSLKMIKMN
jgi:diphthamide synthase subunit DPH2